MANDNRHSPNRDRAQATIEACRKNLKDHLRREGTGIVDIYNAQSLETRANRALEMVQHLRNTLQCGNETSSALSLLTLYELALLIDDSTSMTPARVAVLKRALVPIARIYGLANTAGISSVRFINDHREYNNVKEDDIERMLSSVGWWGNSRIAWALERRILEPFIRNTVAAENGKTDKMWLVLVITDGQVEGEDPLNLNGLIKKTLSDMESKNQAGAIAFQFASIGSDRDANDFLSRLDNQFSMHVDSVPLDVKLQQVDDKEEKEWDAWRKVLCGAIIKTVNQDDQRGEEEEEEDGDV